MRLQRYNASTPPWQLSAWMPELAPSALANYSFVCMNFTIQTT